MGNDGGTVLKRKELVKQQNQTSKEDIIDLKLYNKTGKWSTCSLSNKPLTVPIVSDYLGNLYNKEAILEYLIDPQSFSSKLKEMVGHITGLKDVVELNLQKDPSTSRFVCPITGDELGDDGVKSVYLVRCHDVFSAKCLTRINADENKCPLCNEEYEAQDLIVINPVQKSDIDSLKQRMQDLTTNNLSHSLKKIKTKSKDKSKNKTKSKTTVKEKEGEGENGNDRETSRKRSAVEENDAKDTNPSKLRKP